MWIGHAYLLQQPAHTGGLDYKDFTSCRQGKIGGQLRTFIEAWLRDNSIRNPTKESSVVVSKHYADNGAYLVVPELVANLPILAAKCMAVKGLRYKPTWEVWSLTEVSLPNGESWNFDIK